MTSAELYDPTTGRWSDAASMAVPRSDHTATLLPSGKVLIAGGGGAGPATQADSAELFDPALGTWSRTGDLVSGRELHTATLLPNGQVLVAGGSFSGYLASTELFDPATGRWTRTGDLAVARGIHTATLLLDGQVLVAGGYPGPAGNGDASAELYDPTARSWSSAGTMSSRRFYHAAALLRNGSVLVTGGRGAGPSAEIFTPAGGADDVPPVTTATLNPTPNAAGWNRGAVTITLRALDGGSGVASISYSATGAQAIPPTTIAADEAAVTVGREGVTTLTYQARDRAGNQELSKTQVVRVDRTAPVLRVKDLMVPATGPDGATIDRYRVFAADRLDPHPVVRCTPPAPLTVPIQPVGTSITVACTATDRAGNVASRSFGIHVAGAAEQLSALQADVAHIGSRRVERRLGRDLLRASQALDQAKPRRACHSLDTFVRHVERFRHRGTLSSRQADRLIADSVRITGVIDCRRAR